VKVERCELADVRSTLEHRHYLRRCRTGRQLNYTVTVDGVVDGVITFAYPMMSADVCGIPSDEIVEFARLFLASNIPHTASCAIGQALRRIRCDWATKFPDAKPLRLVVSWSDAEYHLGTVYKASNFTHLHRTHGAPHGNTAASKRGARTKHGDYNHDKDCWVYPLDNRTRKIIDGWVPVRGAVVGG
jgi:hypothetical protein